MSSPEIAPEIRQHIQINNHAKKEVEHSVRNVELPAQVQRSTFSSQRLNVLLSNLRTDPFCWLCHSTVVEVVSPVRCCQCRRLFHKTCWTSHLSTVLNADGAIAGLPQSCIECLAVVEENSRPDKVLSRVGLAKFKTYLLYMLNFVEEKLEKENAGPFAKSTRHPVDCDEVLCPAALLRLKQKIADGQYCMTYAEFLADLRGLLHKSIVIHGEDSGYSRAASYLLDSCMQLCNSMDWCEECFERALPRPGESIVAAILRSLVNPCSKLHVVVCVKVVGKLWPALVYRYHGEFVNVRFFGTMEFGRVHRTSVFLLFDKFELELLSGQSERTSTDAAHEQALRQCRLHVSKLMLIPECSVEFFPKVTPYDGRLFMKIHSIHSLLTKTPGPPKSSVNVQRLKGNKEPIRSGNFEKRPNSENTSGVLVKGSSSEQTKRPRFSSPSVSPTTTFTLEVSTPKKSDLNMAAVTQKRQQTFHRTTSRGTTPESYRGLVPRGSDVEILTPNYLKGARQLSELDTSVLSSNGTDILVLRGNDDRKRAMDDDGLAPAGSRPLHSQTSRKTTEPRRFPHLTDCSTKSIQNLVGNQRGLSVGSLKTRENSTQDPPSAENLTRSEDSNSIWLTNGDSSFKSKNADILPLTKAGDLHETTHISPTVPAALCNGGSSNDTTSTATVTEGTPLVIEQRNHQRHSAKQEEEENRNHVGPGRSPEAVEQKQKQSIGSFERKELMQIFEEMAKISETQQNFMQNVQEEISLAGRECVRQFAETQEKLEAMSRSQLTQSQKVFAATDQQLQKIVQWVTIQNTTETEVLAYKRGRQDALRNRANWIDQTKQNFWCCVCRHQARLLCCGVTLYCSETCQRADQRLHGEHCRRLIPAGFDDSFIQTPYGDLSLCQTLSHSDLNTLSPEDELDQI